MSEPITREEEEKEALEDRICQLEGELERMRAYCATQQDEIEDLRVRLLQTYGLLVFGDAST